MTQTLPKFFPRSPRYLLQTSDQTLIRFAGPKNVPWEEGTEIRNISLTGLAFTAPSDLCPTVGEFVRIQFEVPGGKQMACHAIVTRLEAEGTSRFLVGVKFHRLELAHRIILAQSLATRLRDQQKKENFLQVRQNFWRYLIPAALLIVWSVFFYLLIR